jgi:tripartite-type tricarboxylate transporter receptor subunit TctC
VVARLETEAIKALALKEFRQQLSDQGIEPAGTTSAQFAQFMRSESPKWAKIVRDSGARVE